MVASRLWAIVRFGVPASWPPILENRNGMDSPGTEWLLPFPDCSALLRILLLQRD